MGPSDDNFMAIPIIRQGIISMINSITDRIISNERLADIHYFLSRYSETMDFMPSFTD